MKKLSFKARALFDRVFPERQIYHRSGGTVHYISVSPWQQAMLAAGVTAIAGWTAMTTVNYVFGSGSAYDVADGGDADARYQRWIQELRANTALSRSLLEERTEDFQRVTAEFEERHQALTVILDALESGKDLDLTTLRGDDAALLLDATIDEADARQGLERMQQTASLEVVGVRARINELEQGQEAWLNKAEDIVVERAERARAFSA